MFIASTALRTVTRAIAGVVVMSALTWGTAAAVRDALPLPACATEDQVTDCYWDAQTRSNGAGRSFEVRDGVVFYADGETVAIPASELEGVTR
ncbi:hypothetical protein [Microbacterium sp. VKM Ac-2923]|uniref:hypothetical protein n=1 Tax=Microbacterium sp. VKM Ac-2923 TaxID=2929476 RepID=UPI001FB5075A|nr:hypothetical protein [Microbacterium sp. VKM Ac-2923]MCJ1709248.1 hypothetical protein [Microbacterium sp. VKM Ac-2923]